MQVILYSTHCPCCEVLERGLRAASIPYETVTDTRKMIDLGMTHVPMLSVDGKMMNYLTALAWLKERMDKTHADQQV